MLSPSLSDYSLNEQHYLFLSRSLTDLERLVEQHRAEQYLIFDRLIDAGFMEPQIEQRQETRRHLAHQFVSPNSSTSGPRIEQHRFYSGTEEREESANRRRQSRNAAIAELGTKDNPIYVLDDDEVRCNCNGHEGHFIVDCTRDYQFNEQVRRTGTIRADPGRSYFLQ